MPDRNATIIRVYVHWGWRAWSDRWIASLALSLDFIAGLTVSSRRNFAFGGLRMLPNSVVAVVAA